VRILARRTAATAPCCAACRHFCGDPLQLERESPGLAVLSSAFGAVRAGDGICRHHDRYVSMQSHCTAFSANH
jgi:hypothetical protein